MTPINAKQAKCVAGGNMTLPPMLPSAELLNQVKGGLSVHSGPYTATGLPGLATHLGA